MKTSEISAPHNITALPDSARVWIFQSNRALNPAEQQLIHEEARAFSDQWRAHGTSLAADGFLYEGLFLILGVDETRHGASGCSIDTATHFVRKIGNELGINWMDRLKLGIKTEKGWEIADENTVRQLLDTGKIHRETLVANTLVSNVGELKTQFFIPLEKSWMGKRFF